MNSQNEMWSSAVTLVREGKSTEALFLFERLASEGKAAVFREMGRLYERGGVGLEKDFDKALCFYRKGYHEHDCADCVTGLGRMYYHGRGVEQSYKKALEYFELVSGNDQPVAHLLAGIIFHNGLVGEPNLLEAEKYYKKAVSSGNVWGIRNLGLLRQQTGYFISGLMLRMRAVILGIYIQFRDERDRRLQNSL